MLYASAAIVASLPYYCQQRQLVGSLITSYDFKVDGLMKETGSVAVLEIHHSYRLISYCPIDDVINRQLRLPSQHDSLRYIRPRSELTRFSLLAVDRDKHIVQGRVKSAVVIA